MPVVHFAYAALIAAIIALRIAGGSAPVSASDRAQSMDASGHPRAVQSILGAEDSTPLMTGRSVAVSVPKPSDTTDARERRSHESIGAAGFARR